ncbi:MAG: cardiolipin synthase [Chthoniobacteraceae bacterium]
MITWIVLISHVLGVITSIRAVMEVRTAQGSIAWIVVLNAFPYLSVPAFWVFGRSKFHGYVKTRRAGLARTDPTARQFFESLRDRGLMANPERIQALVSEKLSTLPLTTGNDLELLIDGKATFRSIFEGIEQAKEQVLVEFYIIRDDEIGRELQKRLLAKARAGLRVYLVYDEMGCSDLPATYLQTLRQAGVNALPFNTTQGTANRWQLNFRNHRKIVVVDGEAAWVGGHNVGDEYLGRDAKIGPWRDTHVKVTGPVVHSVQMAFLEDWHWASGELLTLNWDPYPAASGARRDALCLPSGPSDRFETCTLFFQHIINSAAKRLWIASPYFVPDEQFVSALQLAALRGVDVRVLVPEKTDNFLVNLSGWSYVPELENAGIRVFRHGKGFMHQKVTLIDDRYCTIGTANFDNRSFRLNFEITIAVADTEFASEVESMLEQDFADAREVHAQEYEQSGFWKRFAVRAARLMAPVQ